MLLSRTLLLKDQPKGALHSLDELFALADAMEQEAARKYDELATAMDEQGRRDLAAVFADLAAAEREHVESVTRWSQSRLGKPPDPALVRWQAPETFDSETTSEIKASRLITPYQALAIAVQNEERAFAFWSYMAAFADDRDVEMASEAMAREELGHVATLRRARRRAYHREHLRGEGARPAARAAEDKLDARMLELRLATHLDGMAHHPWDAAGKRLRELHEETLGMAAEAAGIGSFPAEFAERDAQAISEALAEIYLAEADQSDDQNRVALLQRLAMKAIARLAWLRSIG
jgi:rubrerythrin